MQDVSQTETTYDPYAPAFKENPYPFYQALRAGGPVHFVERRNFWVLCHWDVVHDATSNPAYSVSAGVQVDAIPADAGLLPPYFNSISTIDPPEHTRLRRLVQKLFTPRVVRGWDARFDELADRLMDDMLDAAADGSADAVLHLARPLPLTAIADLVDIPMGDRQDIARWAYDAGVLAFAGLEEAGPEKVMAALTATTALGDYFKELVAERRRSAGDRSDIVSEMLKVRDDETGEGLTEFEVIGHVLAAVLGGLETTSSLIANCILALLTHPEELHELRANPGGVRNAVEETLRWDPPAQGTFRNTLKPVRIGDIEIPAGARVQLLWASANRDETRFPDGDGELFDVRRDQPGHLAFALGPHYCLGAALARAEARAALQALLRRTTHLELRAEAERNAELMPITRTCTTVPVSVK